MFNKHLLVILLSLGAIAGSLFTIFVFLATMSFGWTTGLVLFLLVTALLIAGYILAFMLLAFLAISLLTRYWQNPANRRKPPLNERSIQISSHSFYDRTSQAV
jgi:membrane protein implicated in regulation of membrane protease activity